MDDPSPDTTEYRDIKTVFGTHKYLEQWDEIEKIKALLSERDSQRPSDNKVYYRIRIDVCDADAMD